MIATTAIHKSHFVKSSSFGTTSSPGLFADAACSTTVPLCSTVVIQSCHHLSNSAFSDIDNPSLWRLRRATVSPNRVMFLLTHQMEAHHPGGRDHHR